MDKLACQLSNVVLLDTRAHRDYFVKLYGLPPEKFTVLYLGCDEEVFYPRRAPEPTPFKVFYYGSFLPVQGIEHIVRAAKLLEHEPDITFQIAGDGMGFNEIRTLAQSLDCQNIGFLGWIPYYQLPDMIAQASVCLGGHFSNNSKAQNVIATKTYQFLAMARPTIVGDNQANREIFTHGEHVYMCRMADAEALAEAILTLRDDAALRKRIAWGGYARLTESYSITRISQILQEIIEQVYAPVPR
jgi:glycosyltransferase involved in cell wall biosynthesis